MQTEDLRRFFLALSENAPCYYTAEDIPAGEPPTGKFRKNFYRPHAHNRLEMICLIKGELALHINGHWRACRVGQVQVFIPGVIHGEHYLIADQSYRLLWATTLPSALIFHVTEYNPLTGYTTSKKRLVITPPMCSHLWQISRQPDFANGGICWAQFHYRLMECVDFFLNAETSANIPSADYHEQIVEQVKHYVNNYYWEDISLRKLADIVHYSPGHLNAIFRRSEQQPLHRYINEIRLLKARQLLQKGDLLIKQVAQAVGFRDPLYFSRIYTRRFGVRPSRLNFCKFFDTDTDEDIP